ncbi:hypothetical protein WAI453_003934 [Rhynchosporium graminicola]
MGQSLAVTVLLKALALSLAPVCPKALRHVEAVSGYKYILLALAFVHIRGAYAPWKCTAQLRCNCD